MHRDFLRRNHSTKKTPPFRKHARMLIVLRSDCLRVFFYFVFRPPVHPIPPHSVRSILPDLSAPTPGGGGGPAKVPVRAQIPTQGRHQSDLRGIVHRRPVMNSAETRLQSWSVYCPYQKCSLLQLLFRRKRKGPSQWTGSTQPDSPPLSGSTICVRFLLSLNHPCGCVSPSGLANPANTPDKPSCLRDREAPGWSALARAPSARRDGAQRRGAAPARVDLRGPLADPDPRLGRGARGNEREGVAMRRTTSNTFLCRWSV